MPTPASPSASASSSHRRASSDLMVRIGSADSEIKLRALRELKNQIVGNRTKKLFFLKLGAVPAVSCVLAEAQAQTQAQAQAQADLLVQSAAALGSFACGFDAGVRAVLDSGAFANLVALLSFPDDKVALDIEYHHNMLVSHQKVNPKEVIVGWYSTGLGVTGGSALIHEFYSREVPNPIHLTVDTGFNNGEGTIKAYVSANLSLGDRQLAAQFQEVPLDLRMVEAERVGFDILKTTMVDKLPNDLEGMEASMERLLALIDDVYKYVDNVVEGHVAPDNSIGRFISETVSSLPKLSPPAFDKLVNDSLQDNLLLLYLSSITRTQLSLAEKLNTAAQIL